MDSVKFLGVTIIIDGKVDVSQYDLGTVTLECEERSYIVDVVSSDSLFHNNKTIIECQVEKNDDMFEEGEITFHDLLPEDFFNKNLKGTIFIGSEYEKEPESQTLFIQFDGGLTKVIKLELE
jgi:hypothetical protein